MTPPLYQCRECRRTYRHAETCTRRRMYGRHSVSEIDTVAPDAHLDERVPYAEETPVWDSTACAPEPYESFDHPYSGDAGASDFGTDKATAYEAKVETWAPEPPQTDYQVGPSYDGGSSYSGGGGDSW